MLDTLLKGFASAVLGGMTTLVGAAIGGYILGIIENLFGGYVSLEFKSVVAFMITLMLIQPIPAADTVVIGALSAFSGPYASLGEDTQRGSNYAVEEAGGKVLGKSIELMFIDTEVKPGVAARKVREASQSKGVTARKQ